MGVTELKDNRSSVRPYDLPWVRDSLVEDPKELREAVIAMYIAKGKQPLNPFMRDDPMSGARKIVNLEIAQLAKAEMYYVSKEMMYVTRAAAEKLPTYRFIPEDPVSEYGMMWFETPLYSYAPDDALQPFPTSDNVYHIHGVTWGPTDWTDTYGAGQRGYWFTFYSELPSGYRVRFGYDNECAIRFGTDIDVHAPESVMGTIGIVATCWLLMRQPLAVINTWRATRQLRRNAIRQERSEPDVRIITLRRPSMPSNGEGDGVDYQHQWLVRGHWQNHYYPSLGPVHGPDGQSNPESHRPVWISPYVKGPEGAPFLESEKVYNWIR